MQGRGCLIEACYLYNKKRLADIHALIDIDRMIADTRPNAPGWSLVRAFRSAPLAAAVFLRKLFAFLPGACKQSGRQAENTFPTRFSWFIVGLIWEQNEYFLVLSFSPCFHVGSGNNNYFCDSSHMTTAITMRSRSIESPKGKETNMSTAVLVALKEPLVLQSNSEGMVDCV